MTNINRISGQQPGGTPRDFIDLQRKVTDLSWELSEARRPQLSSVFLDAILPDKTDTIDLLAAGITAIPHGLGRKYQGWQLASLSAQSTVWEASAAEIASGNHDTTRVLPLKCSADCTVKLVVW